MSGLSAESEALLEYMDNGNSEDQATERKQVEAIAAAAHARGVAEERARLRSALEYVTHRSDCGHGHKDVIHVAPAHFTGPACPHCSDAEYADLMEREDPCLICAALAAFAPTSPSDARGAPEGDGTA